jgi:hypothetical protein
MRPRRDDLRKFGIDAVLIAAAVVSLAAILWTVMQLP